ncbi:elongator complex protein 5 [Caerostris extrusa]|uniref:Elongator complex protein 5 n=1 Tax=Caerostris extrusa TaxID=172846 RepID=A0AAV4QXL7_CAEEX|nr:elongator complex protein 5 [Caerostris extrusa]
MYLRKEPLSGNGKAKFLLVEDSTYTRGIKILKTILKIYCKEQANISALCYDGIGEELLYGMDANPEKVKLLDIFSDPYGWYEGNNLDELMSVNFIIENFCDYKGVLCIYSLTSLLIHNGIDKVYKMLHRLLHSNADLQILAFCHLGVHDLRESEIINRIATTSLRFKSEEDVVLLQSTVHYSSGKITSQLWDCKIDDNFNFLSIADVQLKKKPVKVKEPDPTENLTFNLLLNDEEMEVRSQVQLPYTQVQNSLDSVIENDYDDEEDPDDDLDI